jgi:hypothetical protein
MRIYYAVEFVYSSKKRYCVWYTDEADGFLLQDNQVLGFSDMDSLKAYCHKQKLLLDLELEFGGNITSYDIDKALTWTAKEFPDFDYNAMLNFWNATSDVANSVSVNFYGDSDGIVLDVYRKVFYANNLPSIKKDREDFIPTWDEEELLELKKVMRDAVRIVCKYCLHTEVESL